MKQINKVKNGFVEGITKPTRVVAKIGGSAQSVSLIFHNSWLDDKEEMKKLYESVVQKFQKMLRVD